MRQTCALNGNISNKESNKVNRTQQKDNCSETSISFNGKQKCKLYTEKSLINRKFNSGKILN
jgi:hypothetical protein